MRRIRLKLERSVINVLILLATKTKPIAKNVYENNTMIKTEGTLIINSFGCGKTFLMVSLLKDKNPDDVHIICKTDNQYLLKYHNQSSEILPLEDYGNKTSVFVDMLGSKEPEDIDAFFTRGRHQNLDIYYIPQSWYELPKTLFDIIVVGFCCFHKN